LFILLVIVGASCFSGSGY
ncbi:YjcZ family sporulation protein, partial [Priestia megaterium]